MLAATINPSGAQTLDWLLLGGTVLDGSGQPPYAANVGIRGERIVMISAPDAPLPATNNTLDVTGHYISPGFIDLHTHARADLIDPENSLLTHYLTQGVTTVLIGNDGDGATRIADRFDRIFGHGSGVNVAQFVGHSSLRRRVMPRTDRPASEDEIRAMQGILEQSLREGAMGLSSGLFYTDANHAETDEVVALAQIVARFNGIYDTHMRSESSRAPGVGAALEEAIEIGRRGGVPVHIAHIKALGKDAWGMAPDMVALIDKANTDGVRVTADQYPWEASSTQLKNAVISREWQAGGPDEWRRLLSEPATRSTLLQDIAENIERRGGPASLMIVRTGNTDWDGLRLSDIARNEGINAAEMAANILMDGTPRVISFNMQEADMVVFMRQPWVATSSDGTVGHPRRVASFPRKYHRFVRELGVLTPAEFVRSASGLPADILGIQDRGYLRPGAMADVVVFDPAGFRERASYEDPEQLSSGVVHLWVNGTQAIADGKTMGSRSGLPLRRQRQNAAP
jgi:N-acyl-D-aspartate/D-glutamate deacylase